MKLTITKKILEDALQRVDRVTGKHLSLPVLKGVLFETSKSNLFLRATNLDLGIEQRIPSKIEKQGSFVVSGSPIAQFLSNTKGDEVTLEHDGKTLGIRNGPTRARVKTLDSSEFPKLPNVSEGKSFSFPSKDLVKGLKSVWYSASHSSMKPELSSVFIEEDDGEMVFAATDSFRLAEKRVRIKTQGAFKPILIPLKNVGEIIKTLEVVDGSASMSIGDNQIGITAGDIQLTSRTIDGTFPDYKQIIPKDFVVDLTVLKEEFSNALKAATVFSNRFNQVMFSITPKKKNVSIQTENRELGESNVALDAVIDGEQLTIGFNYRYIVDSLQALTTDSITLRFSGEGKPLVVHGVGDKSFTYLVMPMNR